MYTMEKGESMASLIPRVAASYASTILGSPNMDPRAPSVRHADPNRKFNLCHGQIKLLQKAPRQREKINDERNTRHMGFKTIMTRCRYKNARSSCKVYQRYTGRYYSIFRKIIEMMS